MVETTNVTTDEVVQLPKEWFDRAEEAARRYKLPVPESTVTAEEVERKLQQFAQDDGQ